jgi:hypothetical protein
MRYPVLVDKRFCKTDIKVILEREGLNKYGEPFPSIILNLKCNYQDNAKTVLTAEKKLIQLSGSALFVGDICPELPALSGGSVEVLGVKRRIFQGVKARNPDGTVNYTRLDLV